jgi:hypothetical protein
MWKMSSPGSESDVTFRDLQELLRTCRADPDDLKSSENFERMRDLAITAGAGTANGQVI